MLVQSHTNEYKNDAHVFLQILHHDALNRNGFFVKKNFGEQRKEFWSRNSLELPSTEIEIDTYVSINSYHGKTRNGISMHSLNALYFDLDWHNAVNQGEISNCIENTLKALKSASNDGLIPYPTMVTKTGRGLGLFYVLDKSIANTEKTSKQIRLWEYVYKEIANQIETLLSDCNCPVLELDHKVVADKGRICRLPGTINSKSETICSLFEINKEKNIYKYYTLKELASFVPNYKVYNNEPSRNNVVSFELYKSSNIAPMLIKRLKKLERAQDVLKHIVGCRELLCFYYYNTAVQLYTPLEAQQMLFSYNDKFTQPIGEHELLNIIRSVSSAVDQAGKTKGYYKVSDKIIYKNLALERKLKSGLITQDQVDYIGLCQSSKSIKRAEIKAANKQKKEERDQSIVAYLNQHPSVTYKEAAVLFGVSLRTINNIAKKYNIHRYTVKDMPVDEMSLCDTSGSVFEPVMDNPSMDLATSVFSMNMKMQKNALVSLCCDKQLENNNINNILIPPRTRKSSEKQRCIMHVPHSFFANSG